MQCRTGLDARTELGPNGSGNPVRSRGALKVVSTNNDSFDIDPANSEIIEFSIGSVPDDISGAASAAGTDTSYSALLRSVLPCTPIWRLAPLCPA